MCIPRKNNFIKQSLINSIHFSNCSWKHFSFTPSNKIVLYICKYSLIVLLHSDFITQPPNYFILKSAYIVSLFVPVWFCDFQQICSGTYPPLQCHAQFHYLPTKLLHFTYSTLFLISTKPLATTDLFIFSIVLLFLQCHIALIRIISVLNGKLEARDMPFTIVA